MPRDLERRLAELESRLLEEKAALANSEGNALASREFVSGVLTTIAHVRRAPIDHPPYGYEIEKLHALEPWALAQHVAALTILRHEDEAEAREILAFETEDEPVLWDLIEVVVEHLGQLRSQRRKVGL